MASTRSHPRQFPPPDLSPSKVGRADTSSPPGSASPTKSVGPVTRARGRSISAWSHTTSLTTLVGLAVSLPLVMWDTGYVLGRPHTMIGGKLHEPIYTPYALYASIDYLYG